MAGLARSGDMVYLGTNDDEGNTMTTIGTHLSRSFSNVDSARRAVAQAAANGTDPASLSTLVQALAMREGAHYVISRAADLVQGGQAPADIALAILDTIAIGPDDQWSGRGNDLARARFDGMLDAVKAMRYDVLIGRDA